MEDIELGRLRIRSCTSKKKFNLKGADDSVDKFAAQGTVMYYYKCSFCTRYHLTSSPPKYELNDTSLKAIIEKFNEVPVLPKKHK